ncbi:sulfite exporter TauE/SafE family protein [Nonomuraea sp. NPDC059194]|uniref:urease accessory protein UreH domain-containing protein n=1 Tax=Nonomuraea sp. NPDC059194 TaxID=3346764 RepID=UPI0036C30B0C
MDPVALFVSGLAAGLVAGTASCTAMQGGLLFGLTGASPWTIGQFLTGRLAVHAVAGGLLGALGSAIRLPAQVRAALLVAAGIAVILFAVRSLRHGRCASPPPGRPLSAPLLGAATILLPCGVTLAMEVVAVSSGSAIGGVAVLTGFVLGTSPALALLGLVLRRISRTRLAVLGAAVAAAVGLWTIGSGLSLGGWLPRAAPATAAAGLRGPGGGPGSGLGSTVTVWATNDGYRPGIVTLPARTPVTLVFRTNTAGCARTVTIAGKDVALPATVRLPPQEPGTLRYSCAMGMYPAFIRFVASSG